MKDYDKILDNLLAIGTDHNTAVEIVAALKRGFFPRGLNVSQAIVIGWL